MLLNIFRGIFILVVLAVMFVYISSPQIAGEVDRANFYAILWSGFGLAAFAFLLEVLTPKRSLAALAGVFFGLLIGIFTSWALSQVLDMVIDIYQIQLSVTAVNAIRWLMGISICYLTISIVIRTKDDVRFVIPYVEFAKQTKGARPFVLDTSVVIDGRLTDLCQSKVFDAPLSVPRFVLNELQLIADSTDKLKRNRGRRGLDILKKMQLDPVIDLEIDEIETPEVESAKGVDQKLVAYSKDCDGRLVTTDYNLTKVAQVRGVDVININELANSLKTVALPGEAMKLKVVKPGEEAQQGIGYLDDGTMIVVENARDKIGRDIYISITSSLQTSAGKMIFGKFEKFAESNRNDRYRTESKRPTASKNQ